MPSKVIEYRAMHRARAEGFPEHIAAFQALSPVDQLAIARFVKENFIALLRARLAVGSWEEVGRVLGQIVANRAD